MNILLNVPEINNKKELKDYIKPLYIIDDLMKSYEDYKTFEIGLNNIVRGSFQSKECREYPIKFKFYKQDKKTHTIELRMFLINIYLWYPFCELKGLKILDESFILNAKNIPTINEFINEKIILTLQDHNVKQTLINQSISNLLYDLRGISLDFSNIMGLTFSEKTFIDMYDNPKFRDMMDLQFEEGYQPVDIEHKLNSTQAELISNLKSIKDNPIGIILRSGTGIKNKQLAEYLIAMGMKPTLTGEVMTKAIETSSLIGGLNKPSYMYIDASGARKPLIMNNKEMGKAGYFGKIVLELSRTLSLSKDISDCNTSHLVTYNVKNKKTLDKLNGKYYKISEDDDDYKVINSKKDSHLIGRMLKVRSAITCACGKNHVCARCVGKIANLNWDIADGLAAFESEEFTKVLEQNILSSKHLLTTQSERIEFSEEFYKYFSLSAGEINPSFDDNVSIDDLAIYIVPEEIEKFDEFDTDSPYNNFINSGRFFIRNTKTNEDIEIKILEEKEIYIRNNALALMKSGKGLIRFKDLDESEPIFEVVIMNNELTKPLYGLMALLNKGDKSYLEEVTIDSMANKFIEIMIESGIGASAVAGELILNRLVRKADNVRERPDFSKVKMPDYRIYTVKKVLENNGSALIGLGFENLQRQLLNPELENRQDTSYMDVFFKEKLSSKELLKYRDFDDDNELFDNPYYLNSKK